MATSNSLDDTKEMSVSLHFTGRGRYRYYTVDEYRGRMP